MVEGLLLDRVDSHRDDRAVDERVEFAPLVFAHPAEADLARSYYAKSRAEDASNLIFGQLLPKSRRFFQPHTSNS